MPRTVTATISLSGIPTQIRSFEPHAWSDVLERHWMWFVLALGICLICFLIGMWNRVKERFIKEKPGALSFREYGLRLQKLEEDYESHQENIKQSQIDELVDSKPGYEAPVPDSL